MRFPTKAIQPTRFNQRDRGSLVYRKWLKQLRLIYEANRDYRYKRSEYAAWGIAEYWIVDPIAQKLTILEWVEGFYDERVYEGDKAIASSIFPELTLTASQVLQR